jgi:hypothetical protein
MRQSLNAVPTLLNHTMTLSMTTVKNVYGRTRTEKELGVLFITDD